MIRLFTAISLPDSIKQELQLISCGVPGARWMEEDQMHLTLRFIGEVESPLASEIQASLAEISFADFSIQLKGVGHFPPRGHPKILWAGVDPNQALRELKNRIDSALRRLGVESDPRKYHPHITLARLREAPEDRVGQWIVHHGLFSCPAFPAEAFHLLASSLYGDGARHSIEGTYPLVPAA